MRKQILGPSGYTDVCGYVRDPMVVSTEVVFGQGVNVDFYAGTDDSTSLFSVTLSEPGCRVLLEATRAFLTGAPGAHQGSQGEADEAAVLSAFEKGKAQGIFGPTERGLRITSIIPAGRWVAVYLSIGDDLDIYLIDSIAAWALGEGPGGQFVRPLVAIGPEGVGGLALGREGVEPDGSGLVAYFPSEAIAIEHIKRDRRPGRSAMLTLPDGTEAPLGGRGRDDA